MQPLRSHIQDARHFTQSDWVALLVTVLIEALFIFFAARIVIDRGSYIAAIVAAVLGSLAAGLVLFLAGSGVLGWVLALAAWALIVAALFRTGWLKGAVIGLVAWVLNLIVFWVIGKLT